MPKIIKIQILEDTDSDVFLIERQLKKASVNYNHIHSKNREEFIEHLDSFKPDIILSDYSLPGFNGLEALNIVLQTKTYIPFIIVTGALDEETAVSCLKAGADDYLTKENLTRLVPSVKSVLEKRDTLREKLKAEKSLKESEQRLKTLIGNLQGMVYRCKVEPSRPMLYISKGANELTGYTTDEFMNDNQSFSQLIQHEDKEKIWDIISRAISKDLSYVLNYRIIDANGQIRWIWDKGKKVTIVKTGKDVLEGFMTDVTAQKNAENALLESEKRFRAIYENLPLAYHSLDESGIITDVNPAWLVQTGYKKNSVIGKEFSKFLNQDSKESFYSCFEEFVSKGDLKNIELNLIKADTEEIIISMTGSIGFDYSKRIVQTYCVFHDITEKKKVEAEIKQLAKELQVLIQTVNVPIIGIDVKGRVSEWNMEAEELTGIKKANALERDFINDFIIDVQRNEIKQIIEKTVKGAELTNFEALVKSKDAYTQLLLNTTIHRNSFGDVMGVIFVGQDITEIADYREELEKKIEERTKELRTALEKERELSELKSRFVSMASHEFRTPLAAIGFASGFLKKYIDRIDKEAIEKRLNKIDAQIKHMTALLDDVLTIGKADAGKKFNPEKINFIEFIQTVLEEVKVVTKHSHQIHFKNSRDSFEIEMDPKLGRNIFINLLVNAIKFSPGKDTVVFETSLNQSYMISKITDYGIGIPDDELKNIFTPFHRAKNTETIQGTGLGLPIVKEAIEAHGGEILVSSKRNEGTVFTVKLPLIQKEN